MPWRRWARRAAGTEESGGVGFCANAETRESKRVRTISLGIMLLPSASPVNFSVNKWFLHSLAVGAAGGDAAWTAAGTAALLREERAASLVSAASGFAS